MDLLSDVLAQLRLKGTLYFRTAFTSPWGVRVPAFKQVARFHLVHRGNCLVRVEGVPDLIALSQGDLIIITRGAGHSLFCDPANEHEALHLEDVVERSGFTGTGALVFGGEPGTNNETQLVCGHFAFDPEAHHPLIDALPPYIHLTSYGDRAGTWLEGTLRMIGGEAGRDLPGGDLIALRLAEIIFAQALRSHLNKAGSDQPVLAGFTDRQIVRALKAVHDTPSHPWTLEELAAIAGMSRTSFAARFSQTLSMSPLAYITHWRLQLAKRALETTDAAIISIAEQVGYHSEAAFGRVFKKHSGIGPAAYRRDHGNRRSTQL